jgi:hypothetical protein
MATTTINITSTANKGLFAQTGASIPVSNSTAEATLLDGGVGSLNIPANGFNIGDSFSATLAGHMSSANNNTLRIRIKSGSVILGDTGVITLPSVSNKHWEMELRFTIRSLGAAGVAEIAAFGQFTYSKNSGNQFEGIDFVSINNSTFDTTVSNTLDVTAQWGTASASNSINTESFVLNKTY